MQDTAIANSIRDFQFGCMEDKLIVGRCLYNYSRGIPLQLNCSRRQFEVNGPSLRVDVDDSEDTRRCSMQPVSPLNIKNSHFLEPSKGRFHVDALIHRMLLDSNGKLFGDLIETCVISLYEFQQSLQVLLRLKTSIFDSLTYFRACGRAADAGNVSIIYLRATLQWLSIANMLGYQNPQIQQIAREIAAQSIAICKISSLVNRTRLPIRIIKRLDGLVQVALVILKSLIVYNEALAYSTFDTDFDTFRLVEKLYKPCAGQGNVFVFVAVFTRVCLLSHYRDSDGKFFVFMDAYVAGRSQYRKD
ncbi:hypothetical protein BdWA1_001977 [Babesia duncani]|uniref:Uncharacterized protein n=1 Tax=Babesia duncani TaxID=323732 RepID=A0AAD9PKY4_9APIC|nr:hypothetical protein BdWA1_001977 [Babesia duncani]